MEISEDRCLSYLLEIQMGSRLAIRPSGCAQYSYNAVYVGNEGEAGSETEGGHSRSSFRASINCALHDTFFCLVQMESYMLCFSLSAHCEFTPFVSRCLLRCSGVYGDQEQLV